MGLDNITKSKKKINLSAKSNNTIRKSKSDRKNVINERRQTAHAKKEGSQNNIKEKNALREDILRLAQDAQSPEDKEKLENNIAKLEKEIESEQLKIEEANKDIEMYDVEATEIEKEADDDDDEPGSPSEAEKLEGQFQTGNLPGKHQDVNSDVASALAEAFQKGLALGDNIRTYHQAEAISRKSQAILGYKHGYGNSRVAIVAECDVAPYLIYRIRRDVIVSSDKVDIIQTRRAGTGVLGKGSRGNIKWTADDIAEEVGIAIEVPPGYQGNPEDLVKRIPPLTVKEKEEKKAKGERIPVQAEVQLIIRWKLPKALKGISDNYFLSFESRATCHAIYGIDKADRRLWEIAKEAEESYRNEGGLYSVEEGLPKFDAFTPIGSREASEEPEGEKNDKENDGNKNPEGEKKKQEEDKKKEEEEEEEKRKRQAEEKRKLEEDKKMKNYELLFRFKEDIDPNAEFTAEQTTKFKDEYNKASAT